MEISFTELADLLARYQATDSTLDTASGLNLPPPGVRSDPLDPRVGDKVLIRTVTMTLVGQLTGTSPTWLVLDQASWVADSGRWSEAIAQGFPENAEIEPMGDNVRVARGAIVDVAVWTHELPTGVQ